MVVKEIPPKKSLHQLLANAQAQITRNVDFIPVGQWGFDEAATEVLKKQKHDAVNKQLSKSQKKKLDNSKKQKIAQSIGAVPQTVSQTFDILSRSKLANRKQPRPNVRLIKNSDSDETKENGLVLDPEIAEKLKKKGVGKRPFVRNAILAGKKRSAEDAEESDDAENEAPHKKANKQSVDENGVPFKKARRQRPPVTEDDKKKRRELSKLNRKKKANAAKEQRNTEQKAAAEAKIAKNEPESKPTNENDGISYSKIDFVLKDDKPLTKKDRREKLSGRDYASLQKKVEKRQEYVEKVREKNPEKAEGLEEKFKWETAMKRAEGKKVKDNPALLEKAVRVKTKQKDKRKQKWGDRKEKVKQDQEKKQDKREANIKKRREVKVNKKMERARKKGRVV